MENKTKSIMVIVGIAAVLIIILSTMTFITLKPGEKGIVFRKFTTGLDKEHIYGDGFHIVAPWNKMIIYNVKEQAIEENMDVLDRNGLSLHVDVTVRFQPIINRIGELHERFGQDYPDKLIRPEVRSMVRQVMGRYSAEEIYSTKRREVEHSIITETDSILKMPANNIHMTALLIRSIVLPEQIKSAIQNKLEQEQQAKAYEYRLKKEESEAQRKRIMAEGEAAANKIINSSLTPELLRMRGIEATLELSKSNNTKIIVVGSGKDGLPLILGGNN